jgi:arginine-tRNA-protein transferase
MSETDPGAQSIALSASSNGPCPYLDNGRTWATVGFFADQLDAGVYEALLGLGFRRSGRHFYANRCEGCCQCLPLRVDANRFIPSKSQRRVARVNADVEVETSAREYSEERFRLYADYVLSRHGEMAEHDSYCSFLVDSPVSGFISDYYLTQGGKRRLVANGYLDLMPNGLSSVYFAFDPAFSKRSLGVFSVMKEMEIAQKLGLSWYYLGFWVPQSPKMGYKGNFKPFQLARDGQWHDKETD